MERPNLMSSWKEKLCGCLNSRWERYLKKQNCDCLPYYKEYGMGKETTCVNFAHISVDQNQTYNTTSYNFGGCYYLCWLTRWAER